MRSASHLRSGISEQLPGVGDKNGLDTLVSEPHFFQPRDDRLEKIPLTLSMLQSRFDKQSSHARELARVIRQHAHSQGHDIDTRA